MNKLVKSGEVQLIRVDSDDRVLGYESKSACHAGEGLLHRAFSIFIFDGDYRLLIQRRSKNKMLWPLTWSNSVCSHPVKGESCDDAAQRRLQEELGIVAPLSFRFKFQYQAGFKDIGSENELCYVYIGKYDGGISADTDEIAEWKFIDVHQLKKELNQNPNQFTPWFQIEWRKIQDEGHLLILDDMA